MATILIKNGRVWDGEKFFYSDVLSGDGKVLQIQKNITQNADLTFDATNKIVCCGLVDLIKIDLPAVRCKSYGTDYHYNNQSKAREFLKIV